MSKKKRQSRHRVPPNYVRPSDSISDRYQTEVERDTIRLQKRFEAAQKRLATARAKAERVALERAALEAQLKAHREQEETDTRSRFAKHVEAVKAIADAAARQTELERREAAHHKRETTARLTRERHERDLAAALKAARQREADAQQRVGAEQLSVNDIAQLMQPGNTASAKHRGRDSFRPIA